MRYLDIKTKIICTIGPSCETPEAIRELIVNGMSIARLNFSHGKREEHASKISIIRDSAKRLGRPVAILQDLAGPKIRVGTIPKPGIKLDPGKELVLTTEDIIGDKDRVHVNYKPLPEEVSQGDRVLLADGLMELRVRDVKAGEIYCEVITGGVLTSHKGLNLPSGTIKAPSMTEKDKVDLLFGLAHDVDYVGVSFVRQADDIIRVRRIIKEGGKDIPIIAKIEKHEAIKNLDDLMEAADGIMVARGDLGVEIPLEEVPLLQKTLIRKANYMGKPVITATQMLRSMVDSPRPTRAEANDVANAVLDGTDAVMLSEETAIGRYPVEAVGFMAKIIRNAEKGFPHRKYLEMTPRKDVAESVAHAACMLADHLDAEAIVPTTESGTTAIHVSRFRPKSTVLALSPNEEIVRRLCLFWGCIPMLLQDTKDTDDMIEKVSSAAIASELVSKGDTVVITAGHPIWVAGTTNMVRVKRL